MRRILAALASLISTLVLVAGLIGTTPPMVLAADPCNGAQLMTSNPNNPAINPDVHGIYSDQATIFAGQAFTGNIGTLKISMYYCNAQHGAFAQFLFHSYDTTDYQQLFGLCRIALVQSLNNSPLPANSAACPSGTLVNDVAADTPLLPEPSKDSLNDSWRGYFQIQVPPQGYVSNAHVTCDKRDVFPFTGNTACATPLMQNPSATAATTTTNTSTGQTQAGISNFHALWAGDNVPSGNTFNVSPGQTQLIGPIDVTFQNDDSQGLGWNKSVVLMFAGIQHYTGQVNISPDQGSVQPDPGLCDNPVGSNATPPNGTATGTAPGGKDWWSCSPALPIAAWNGKSDGVPAQSSFTFEFHAKVPSTFKHGEKWTVIFRPAEDDGDSNFKWIDTDQKNGDANKAALGGVTYEYFNIFVN